MCRLEEQKGMHMRFAIGAVPEEYRQAIAEEEAKHGAFLHIPIQVNNALQLVRSDACP